MSNQHTPPRRDWYCNDRLTDEYITAHNNGGDLEMAKKLRIVRSIVVNLGLIGITVFALAEGADPTIVGGFGLIAIASYNGVEVADYIALMQAISEVQGSGAAEDGGTTKESGSGGGSDSR